MCNGELLPLLLPLGFAKIIFHEIQRKCVKSAAEGKFRSSAGNSAPHGKLWALIIVKVSLK
jgi:hypothetical protein